MKLFLIFIMSAASVFFTGCEDYSPSFIEKRKLLPTNAKIEKDLGHGWMVFSVDGRKYIYRIRHIGANTSTEVLAPY